MTENETGLAKQIEHLAAEVARLRTTVMIGLAALGVLVVTGFTNRGWLVGIVIVSIALTFVTCLAATLGMSFGKLFRKAKEQNADRSAASSVRTTP